MGFAENLTRMRKQMGMTQIDLSIKSGINPKTLSSYENGRTEPNLGEVVKLCKVFDCSIAHLTDTKEREPGDISLEDIMFKLAKLDVTKLEQIKDHINMILDQRKEVMRIETERKLMEEKKKELEKKLAEYDELLKSMDVAGVRRNKKDI